MAGDRRDAQRVGVPGPRGGSRPLDYIAWLNLKADNLNREDMITADLSHIMMASSGIIEPLEGGKTVALYIDELRRTVSAVKASNALSFGETAARLGEAVDSLERATQWLLAQLGTDQPAALAGATPYLRLFGNAAGGCMLADEALTAMRIAGNDAADRIGMARFFAEQIAVQCAGLEKSIIEGAEAVRAAILPAKAV